MRTVKQHIEVEFRYPVHFVSGVFGADNDLFARSLGTPAGGAPHRLIVVVDRGVSEHHPQLCASIEAYTQRYRDRVTLACAPLVVRGGEAAKNDTENVAKIHRTIERCGLDRHGFVVAVGGGAVLDMVGYAAATAHRGVRLIRVPTTVLSQNDSGVGVKNGINAFGKKNFLGTFAPPHAVLNDRSFLTTLDDRDWRAGISEAIKVALLRDADFFVAIEEDADALLGRNLDAMAQLVYRCAELHLEHIATSGDPFEFGSSRPLDFGHWAAHKLESLTNYRLRHGEAVAAGICLDATYAHLSGMLAEEPWRRILELFERLELPTWVDELDQKIGPADAPDSILGGLEEFREHLGGQLTITLIEAIGRPKEIHRVDHSLVERSIRTLKDVSNQTEGATPWANTAALAR